MSCLSYESIPSRLVPREYEVSLAAATWLESGAWFSSTDASPEPRDPRWLRAAFGLLAVLLAALPISAGHLVGKRYVDYPHEAGVDAGAWHAAPPGLPAGGTFAVMSGDPFAAGPFTMRVRLPPGYALPPYRRADEEQLFILGGAIEVGTVGESGAATTRTLTSGSYVSLPANEIHFANTREGVVLQIVGIGPFRWRLV